MSNRNGFELGFDELECPYCGGDDTVFDSDWLYERRCVVRYCESCDKLYEVVYAVEAIAYGRSA